MTEVLCLLVAVITAVLGMGWLALGYKVHWRQVFPDNDSQSDSLRLKVFGYGFLLLSALSCLMADHPSMAVLVWVMLQTLAAMTIAMMLGHRPSALRWICLPFFMANHK
jgi:Protein of unknown function (DUF3325)